MKPAAPAPNIGPTVVPFPIVGVGASAGGLEAFTQLLTHLPADTGMAFVLVQHLDPQHESALTQLLGRTTTMRVLEVSDRTSIAPNHVFVIPRNKRLVIQDGVLRLQPRGGGRAHPRAIDLFFESLAHDRRERAIGVLLSGADDDGTVGLESIKAEGGITFAQDNSAKYETMPRSAVQAGCVDFELSPEAIARELARIAVHPLVAGEMMPSQSERNRATATAHEEPELPLPSGGSGNVSEGVQRSTAEAHAAAPAGAEDELFKKILLLVRNHAGVDFSLYKSSTIERRIARRVVLNRLRDLAAYTDFVRGNKGELDALYADMLISVTSFFRNPDAFDLIQRKVFAPLIAQDCEAPVRIWVLGCSTGQEAYSLAMAYLEAAQASACPRRLQMFATDLNDALLDKARAGLYAKSLAEDISPERLRRFFVEESGGFRASKELRQHVVFARQNILTDPPFSHMDLISCRNLLIYIEPDLQKRIVPMFHYALNPEGVLFLGASESVAGFTDLFAPLHKKQKIFAKKPAPTPSYQLPIGRGQHPSEATAVRAVSASPAVARPELNAQREADRVALSLFAPPGVLIDDSLQILQFRGPTSDFLEPPTGKASFDVLKMAREGLMLPLRAAINRARKEGKAVCKEQVRLAAEGRTRLVAIVVTPLNNLKERCFLIHFEEESGAPSRRLPSVRKTKAARMAPKEENARIQRLESELTELRDFIEAAQEQSETTNEELQASNEEVTSANEELQSINEELETSKEELESTNEELTTVNEEMVHRNAELSRLNADLRNLHLSINTAILVLGRDLTVRQFTPLAEKIFNLRPTDLGRPLRGVRHNLRLSLAPGEERDAPGHSLETFALEQLVDEAIDSVSVRTREVRDASGRWYSLRIRPYVTLDDQIDGAVLVMVDIDALKRSEAEARHTRDYAESILRTAPVPLLVLRPDLRVNSANAAFHRTFHLSPAEIEGQPLWELGNGRWNIPRLRHLLEEILPRNSFFDGFEVTHDLPDLGRRTMVLDARRLDGAGEGRMILLGIDDVTDRLRLDESVRRNEARFRALISATAQIVWTANAKGEIEDDSASWCDFTGQTEEQRRGSGWLEAVHPEDRDATASRWQECIAAPRDYADEFRLLHRDGAYRWTAVRAVSIRDTRSDVREWVVSHADITERREHEVALGQLNEQRAVELRASRRLQETSTLLIQGGDIEALYQQILAAGLEIMGADMASLIMLEPGDDAMHLLAQAGFDAEFERAFGRVPRDGGSACAAAWRESRRIVVPNMESCNFMAGTPALEQLRACGVVAVQSTPLMSRNGRLIGVLSTHWRDPREPGEAELRLFDVLARQATDLIERKQNEDALSESEARYRTLFNSIDEGFCVIEMIFDAEGKPVDFRFLEVNPSFAKQSGLRDVVGRRMRELAPTLENDWYTNYGRVALTGEPVRLMHEARALNRWFDVYAFRLGGAGSSRVAVIFTDSSERRRIAMDLEHARDEAVAASRAKDEFLAALSHELRTPLNPALLIASDALADPSLPESQRANFEMIRNSIALEARLIDDLLDATRISQGKLVLHRERCEVSSVVRDAIGVVRDELVSKRIQLATELTSTPTIVMGDPVRLQQVFWNVLRNAAHFTPVDGKIAVTTRTNADDNTVEISITDNGVGIASADLEQIFETFTQAHAPPGEIRRAGGLGLGLAISKRMVELHRGSIHATSPGPGKGSTFVITLPIHVARDEEVSPPGSDGNKSDPTPRMGTRDLVRRRVLIVDDHGPTRTTLHRLLERRQYEVYAAGSFAEALTVGKRHEIEVLISDIGLPDGDGYRLMQFLRAERPQIRGIALSGYGAESDVARSRQAGFIEHLTKPVNAGMLDRALYAATQDDT